MTGHSNFQALVVEITVDCSKCSLSAVRQWQKHQLHKFLLPLFASSSRLCLLHSSHRILLNLTLKLHEVLSDFLHCVAIR